MNQLNLVIELSDLLEAAGCEGAPIAQLFDEEIFPAIRKLDEKAEPFGLGDRFARVLEKVRATVDQHGSDRVRTLRDIMKSALMNYVRKTHDAVTARDMYHRAVMSGTDVMFTVAAAAFLANALSGPHENEAKMLMRQVAGRLTGRQPVPAMENASGAAVGSGSIAVAAKGMKKRRRDSIFVEGEGVPFPNRRKETDGDVGGVVQRVLDRRAPHLTYPKKKREIPQTDVTEIDHVVWDDLIGNPAALDILRE